MKTVKNELSDKIKALDRQKKNSREPVPLEKYFWLYTITGAKGSGKTTLFLNLMKKHFRKEFDNIYLISTTAKNDLKLSKLVDELDRENKFQTEISNEILDGVLEEIDLFNKSIVEQDEDYLPKNLIVFDDCVHLLPKAYTKNSSFNKLITAQRHFKTCVIIMSQKYKMLNSLIRNNQDLISIFPVHNEFEKKTIIDDINVPEKIWEFAMSGEDDHPFLHVSYCAGKPLYFRKFDRIEYEK